MPTYKTTVLERVEIQHPAATHSELPLVVDDWSLCFRLGFTGRTFWYVVLNRDKLYRIFKIPKATGGMRTIHNPALMMRVMSRQLRSRILLPLCAKLGPHVGAYQVGKSTKDSALQHLAHCAVCAQGEVPHTCQLVVDLESGYRVQRLESGTCAACNYRTTKHVCPRRGVKIHMDLKDFFLSTRPSWIRQYFHKVVGYNHYSASLLAHLLTAQYEDKRGQKNKGVPQGSLTSGDICNLVADWKIDRHLLQLCASQGWKYTRYADDLYFSHPQNLPKSLVDPFIGSVERIVNHSGYRLNRKKLKVQRPHRRQRLLGMVLNQKVNVPKEEYRRMKAILTNCIRHGFESQYTKAKKDSPHTFKAWLVGKIAYFQLISPHKAQRLRLLYDTANAKAKAASTDQMSVGEVYEFKKDTA